ncbi:hypothetical protein A2415_01150 [candidate division WWE3 bacterium RIFOXYC1_FULL_39_7]|uniref:Uncharacterized protein n=2 Tax=Katanobacteria TaxID=422282 RepID=A0A1F4X9G4_UNCKA|nr:MAG: hypothetical protein A2415_01150 [candidate division WWE3 bacterium RIFOXYC1_FULL_39_7]OGC78316.1 MAG: hypothetical protein A2619_04100 [candidate division WWE3 bacterium RIFOXYD1_FULL_39_9]
MKFPYYLVQLNSRKLDNDKFKAGCSVSEHFSDRVHEILPRWELERKTFENIDAANKAMQFNALQYLKREYGADAIERVKIIIGR